MSDYKTVELPITINIAGHENEFSVEVGYKLTGGHPTDICFNDDNRLSDMFDVDELADCIRDYE